MAGDLNETLFPCLAQARVIAASWRADYTSIEPIPDSVENARRVRSPSSPVADQKGRKQVATRTSRLPFPAIANAAVSPPANRAATGQNFRASDITSDAISNNILL